MHEARSAEWEHYLQSAMPSKPMVDLKVHLEKENADNLNLGIEVKTGKTKRISVTLPHNAGASLLDSNKAGRFYHCLHTWTPWLIRLERRVKRDYSLTISACDGGHPNTLSMDAEDESLLIPDLYSMRAAHAGEKTLRPMNFSEFESAFMNKAPIMFWRGSTTGAQNGTWEISDLSSLISNPRVLVCNRYGREAGFDLKISRVVQASKEFVGPAREWLQKAGVFADPVDESAFSRYRYYPDIPGNALAWGTIIKHLKGCLVFRAPHPRHLFYYRFMQPWRHYIPIRRDFSDLAEKLYWAEANKDEAAWIAWMGYSTSHRYIRNIGAHFTDAILPSLTVKHQSASAESPWPTFECSMKIASD